MIVFLAPDEKMLLTANEVLAQEHPDILVEQGLLSEGVKKACTLAKNGVEIIITRGGTARQIMQALPEIIVVEVPITAFDLLRTVHHATGLGRKIGVVAFSSMIQGVESLAAILGIEIKVYSIENEFEAETKVLQALHEGAEVIVGGVITIRQAQRHAISHVLIESGAEGILQSVCEAKRIFEARRLEKIKGTLFRTVLDYSYEGVVATNQSGQVVICNPAACRITGIAEQDVLTRPAENFFDKLNLDRLLKTGQEELGQIIDLPKTQILCNKIPIWVNGQISGALATFQDTGKIQQWEAAIRKKIYFGGHVATFHFSDIVAASQTIRDAVSMAKEFAITDSSVLITGETGTGKEVFAQSMHNASSRASKPFVAINCAALPAQILESELFGYVSGAFTGASPKGKAGLLEIAHGGSLFLDEIGELDYAIQGKLLRVIQEKKVMRLGSDKVFPVDVRIIAATNKNLKQRVAAQQFRADLYYRLNVLRLRLPPLRERKEDIRAFAEFMLSRNCKGSPLPLEWSHEAMQRLLHYEWPGNIRELQNITERITAVCRHSPVPADLVARMLRDDDDEPALTTRLTDSIIANEQSEIRQALIRAKGNQTEAAKLLGISRSTLWRRLRTFDAGSTY